MSYSIQEILNLVRRTAGGGSLSAVESTQEALAAVVDTTKNALRIDLDPTSDVLTRVQALENAYVHDTWFAVIPTSSLTGSLDATTEIGTGARFITDYWPDGIDAIVSQIGSDGRPNWRQAFDSSGNPITTAFVLSSGDSIGSYTLSNTPTGATVALVYRYKATRLVWDAIGKSLGETMFEVPIDTDGTLAGNSDVKVASQKATKTYADGKVAHALATAENDVLVGGLSPFGIWVKKTLAEFKTILGLGSAAYTASTDYAAAAKGVTNGDSHDHNGGDGAQIAYSGLSGLPTLGTAAAKDIPATGDASITQVVYGNDTRLTDARTPAAHAHTHASTTGQTANDHHNQAHVLNASDHTVSGLTPGHFLKATGATTFGFAAHGLTYSDVGAEPLGSPALRAFAFFQG